MKLFALALDYDGTTAAHDEMGPLVRKAIADARARGILVLLVTGRVLEELRRVAGDLAFIDGVVAENGGVLHFPDTGHTSVLAPDVPGRFVDELRRLGIPHRVGQTLIDADANDAPGILNLIRALELPLVLIFNGGRVMVMAQGVSKATGLHTMLDTLRRSTHNTLAIGDAENDHELLRLAEVGAAVQWGSAALRAAADVVVPGTGPAGVAAYINSLAADGRLPDPARARRRLRLGSTADGREFSLAVRGRNVLIAGDMKSGKSWVAGLLCEQLILHGYCVCVIDPEGDYRSLEALPGVIALGGDDPPPSIRELTRALRYPDRSIIIDLSQRSHAEKVDYIRSVLPALNAIRRHTGLPHRILLDEAHYFLNDGAASRLLDLDANGYTVVTYWATRLPQALLAATDVIIMTRESNPNELEALRRLCCSRQPVESADWASLGRLATAQAVALPLTEESGGRMVQFALGTRITPHVRHREKYVDVAVSDGRAFVFSPKDGRPARLAATLRDFIAELERQTDCGAYVRRGDFSRWIADVFGDHVLAADLREIELRHRDTPAETVPAVVRAIRDRYVLE